MHFHFPNPTRSLTFVRALVRSRGDITRAQELPKRDCILNFDCCTLHSFSSKSMLPSASCLRNVRVRLFGMTVSTLVSSCTTPHESVHFGCLRVPNQTRRGRVFPNQFFVTLPAPLPSTPAEICSRKMPGRHRLSLFFTTSSVTKSQTRTEIQGWASTAFV